MSNFPLESHVISPWAQAKGATHCFVYRGPSMTPTFHHGDFLYLRSTAQNLFIGDVVVFSASNKNGLIVHRIVSDSLEGLITRGDHNRFCDSPVTLDRIIGKVEFVENKYGIRCVTNGFWGLWLARIFQIIYRHYFLFRALARTPYQLVHKSGVVALIWRPSIVKMQVQKAGGFQVKYIYKHNTIAIWYPNLQRFDCQKPFDLVIPNPEESK